MLNAGVYTDPDRQFRISYHRRRRRHDTLVVPAHVDKCRLARHETILNHARISVRAAANAASPPTNARPATALSAHGSKTSTTRRHRKDPCQPAAVANHAGRALRAIGFRFRNQHRSSSTDMRSCASAAGSFIPQTPRTLADVIPKLVKHADVLIATSSTSIVGCDRRNDCTKGGKRNAILRRAWPRRAAAGTALDDSADHREDASLRLLIVVGADRCFGITAAEQQQHRQHDDGRERGLA